MPVGEMRGFDFAHALEEEVETSFDGIGVGVDYLIEAGGDVAEVGGVLLGISAQSEERSWTDVAEARDYLQQRLDEIGVAWEINESLESRQWEKHIHRTAPPYTEIVTAELTEAHLRRLSQTQD